MPQAGAVVEKQRCNQNHSSESKHNHNYKNTHINTTFLIYATCMYQTGPKNLWLPQLGFQQIRQKT